MVVMQAATSSITERSPYIVRTSMTLPQVTVARGGLGGRQQDREVVSLVSDFAPGIDAETTFKERFTSKGGQVIASCACR
jgi:branched-chain amino acid transport system substrate-binding protein